MFKMYNLKLNEEELREIKKALNELMCARNVFMSTNDKFKESNEKYKKLDLDLIKRITELREDY